MSQNRKQLIAALALLGLLLAIAISYTSDPTPAEPKIRTPVENCMDTWCAFDLANGAVAEACPKCLSGTAGAKPIIPDRYGSVTATTMLLSFSPSM
jgi:hypothetical protein